MDAAAVFQNSRGVDASPLVRAIRSALGVEVPNDVRAEVFCLTGSVSEDEAGEPLIVRRQVGQLTVESRISGIGSAGDQVLTPEGLEAPDLPADGESNRS